MCCLGNCRDGTAIQSALTEAAMRKRYICVICGFIYDPSLGLPEDGIAPGTPFEDLPLNWSCPECGARKADFEELTD
jgi:rubredoxin